MSTVSRSCVVELLRNKQLGFCGRDNCAVAKESFIARGFVKIASGSSIAGRQAARVARVSASTSTPRSMSSGEAYSSGRWL